MSVAFMYSQLPSVPRYRLDLLTQGSGIEILDPNVLVTPTSLSAAVKITVARNSPISYLISKSGSYEYHVHLKDGRLRNNIFGGYTNVYFRDGVVIEMNFSAAQGNFLMEFSHTPYNIESALSNINPNTTDNVRLFRGLGLELSALQIENNVFKLNEGEGNVIAGSAGLQAKIIGVEGLDFKWTKL